MKVKIFALLILPLFLLSACTTYKTQYAGFRPPEGYTNSQTINGLTIGSEAFATRKDAEKAFGFDIKGAGLLPVQVVMENKSGRSIQFEPSQTFLVDNEGRYWNIIPTSIALNRLNESTQMASFIGKGAGKGAILGGLAGTILGAAFGIVSGRNIGEAAARGGAVGAAGGAVIGGTQEGTSGDREYRIMDDLRAKSLEGKVIQDSFLANGFIFFPAEASTAKELRLQYREKETGKVQTINLKFPQKGDK